MSTRKANITEHLPNAVPTHHTRPAIGKSTSFIMATSSPTPPARGRMASNVKTPSSQIKVVTEDITNEDITCECARGRPANGQPVVFCKECQKWLHVKCMLDGEIPPSLSESVNGYICRQCRAVRRSDAAKRGYKSGKNAAAPLSAKRKGSFTGRPFALKKRGRESTKTHAQHTHSSIADMSEDIELQVTTPTLPPSADTAMQDTGGRARLLHCDSNAEVVDSILKEVELPSKVVKLPLSGIGKGKQAARHSDIHDVLEEWKKSIEPSTSSKVSGKQAVRHDDVHDLLEEWKQSTEPPKISCSCGQAPSGNFLDYMLCVKCMRWQHKACMPALEDDKVSKGLLCKGCRKARAEKIFRINQNTVVKSRQRAHEISAQWEVARKTRQAKLQAIISDRLWKEYCQLPVGKSNPAVTELTSSYYSRGRMVPIHPAPQAWVTEVMAKISSIVNPENKRLVVQVNGQDELAFSTLHPEKLRRCLNELAVLTIYQGPLRGKKHELGVLLEVLGLAEKGTFWKG